MSSRKDVIAAAEALNARDRSVVVGSNSLGSGGEIKPAIVYEDLKKMVNVSESSGETSCSVEDTNKLRAILGLKPLRTTGNASAAGGGDGSSEGSGMLSGAAAEAVAVANFKAKEAEEARARELKEIQVRLERAKKKRMLKEKLAGPTLGDSDSGADNGGGASSGSSAADWVKKSRVAALAREAAAAEAKLLAAKREAELEQQDDSSGYSSAHLAGLKVGHGASELLAGSGLDGVEDGGEGGGVVLTLKDQNVLEQDEEGHIKGLNEADDELINVNLVDAQRTAHLKKVKARAKLPAYSGVHDEFGGYDQDTAEGAAAAAAAFRAGSSTKNVLSHYDGVESKAQSLVLGSGGAVASLDNGMDEDATGAGVSANGVGGGGDAGWAVSVPQSLVVAKSVASDFLTAAEVNSKGFKKPKKMRKKKDKASMRTKSSADDEEDNAGAGAATESSSSSSPAAMMNDDDGDVDDDAAGSRKNRNGGGAAAVAAKLAESARLSAFAAAKAASASKLEGGHEALAQQQQQQSVSSSSGGGGGLVAPSQGGVMPAEGDDDDAELVAAMARVRRMAESRDQAASKAKNAALVESFAANAAAKAAAARAEEAAAAQRRENAAFVTAPGGGSKLPPPPPGSGGDGEGVMGMEEDYVPGPDQASVLAKDDNKLVFTSTHEFSARLESSMQERTRARDSAAAAAAAGGGKVPPPPPPRPPPPPPRRPTSGPGSSSSGGGEVVGSSDDVETATADGAPPVTSSGEGEGEEGDEEGEGEEDLGVHGDAQMGFMHRQPLARGGMAATLGLLAATGDLGAKRGYNVEQQVGRAKDERRVGEDTEGGVKIEYRDEDGRLLTQKEAFRQMSYKFHGHGPKQKKQEKRRKEISEMEAEAGNANKEFGTAANLQRTLTATGKSYMALDGGAVGVKAANLAKASYVDDLGNGTGGLSGLEKSNKKRKSTH